MTDSKAIITDFWKQFCEATGVNTPCPPSDCFGDSKALADELLELVLSSQKQATCELKRWFEHHGEAVPKPGDYWIILNGDGDPKCVIRTTHVDVCAVSDVDEKFAWDEGEGDRSLEYWKTEHDKYFVRQAERDGFIYDDSMLCICERFVTVWPQA